jgi:ADP-ribosylglycohydrolase
MSYRYANISNLHRLMGIINDYAPLLSEYGFTGDMQKLADKLEQAMQAVCEGAKSLAEKNESTADEPSDYAAIQTLCEKGNTPVKPENLREKMAGAVLGRFIGCTLGAPVEMWSIADMERLAAYNGDVFPPTDYWKTAGRPFDIRYNMDKVESYTRDKMDGVPVDDDVTYTILGLLIIEKYGFDFTTENVGEIWQELLPMACTAEHVALRNLQEGIPASKAGLLDNPYCQWIGADIRSDGFAFAAAGDPALAASMGYRDAYLSHRRNGIYGEMYFAAVEAAAFVTNDPAEALRIGLKEIPKTCTLYKDMVWALEIGPSLKDYKESRQAVDERFAGMSPVHTNNNACLTAFALLLGKGDFTATVSNTIAMGLDNDCTGATAGSIIGAIVGKNGIPAHWYKNFNDKARTYMNGYPEFSIEDLIDRFVKLAESR